MRGHDANAALEFVRGHRYRNPGASIELALQHKPRAILLDLMMPECSGFELCQSLHSLSYTARIPIFIVSGESAAKFRDYMKNLGATDFFEKPIDFAKLKNRLADELQKKPAERRAHVRVRMNLTLKLKGTDEAHRSFEQLITTENVSGGSFTVPSPARRPRNGMPAGFSFRRRARLLCRPGKGGSPGRS